MIFFILFELTGFTEKPSERVLPHSRRLFYSRLLHAIFPEDLQAYTRWAIMINPFRSRRMKPKIVRSEMRKDGAKG